MSTSSSSACASSSRSRTSWLQLAVFTVLVHILIFSTACCHAVPVWQTAQQGPRGSDGAAESAVEAAAIGDVPSRTELAEFESPDFILRRCASGDLEGTSVFLQTLCSLTMMYSTDERRTKNHEGFVKRGISSDRSSFGAFNRFVHRLVEHANEVSDYQERLNRMQALGLIDNDYNVIGVPHETKQLMMQLG